MNDQITFSTLGSSILAYQAQKVVVYSELVVESIKHLMTENNNLHEAIKAHKDKEDKLRKLASSKSYYGSQEVDYMNEKILQIINEGSDKE